MVRKLYKETIIAIGVVIFFDFLRLYNVITIGEFSLFDFLWLVLLIFILFFNTKTNKDNKVYHLISLILGIIPLFIIAITFIQIMSTGLSIDFNFVFMLFEAILILVADAINFYEFYKYLKSENKEPNNE